MAFVYRFLDKDNNVIYIGKTININLPMQQHFAEVSVLEAWAKVLRPLARYTEQLSFRDGALYVHVVSATLRNDLFLQRTSLIHRVNEAIGRRLLFSIVFK